MSNHFQVTGDGLTPPSAEPSIKSAILNGGVFLAVYDENSLPTVSGVREQLVDIQDNLEPGDENLQLHAGLEDLIESLNVRITELGG